MDLRLLALLILCSCKRCLLQENYILEDDNISVVPLIPLIPSTQSNLDSSNSSNTELILESPKTTSTTDENDESSSEEDLGEFRQAIASGIMKFGLTLLENLKTNPKQPNVIISPLSVSLALSQLALGAKNETEKLLLQHLHVEGIPSYQKALKNLLHHVRKNTLQIASRIYLSKGFKLKPEFVEESSKIYDSKPAVLTVLEEVNKWVEKSTNGHVTDFMASLPPNLVMMLINAVHFKGDWLWRFSPEFTSNEPFYINEEQMVDVDMMFEPKYPLSVFTYHELDAQVARFLFTGNMSLVIIMPNSGQVNVSLIAEKLDIVELYNGFPREKNMHVKFPKLKLDFTQELEEALTSMGLEELFKNPNLEGISEGPLVVSSVHHKSSMEINEKGAEAAAATSVAVSRSNPSFVVNQPFFYALIEDSTQTPLFLGVISNPNPHGSFVPPDTSSFDKDKFPVDKVYQKTLDKPPK